MPDHQIAASTQFDDIWRRLSPMPGMGSVISTTVMALAGDVSRCPSARDFAAWLGLAPRQNADGSVKARYSMHYRIAELELEINPSGLNTVVYKCS